MASRGQIQVEVVADTSKVAARIQKELEAVLRGIKLKPLDVDADTSLYVRKIKSAQDETDRSFRSMFDRIRSAAGKAGAGIGTALGIGLKAALASAVSPAISSVVALIASIGPALLPAIPTAVAVLGTLKVALFGVADAIKVIGDEEKFNEALKTLSPNAQKFALTLRKILPILASVKNSVQDRFFRGFDKDLIAVTKSLTGPVRAGLVSTAGSLNSATRDVAKFAASAKGVEAVNAVFSISNVVLARLTGLFGPLLDRVADWVIAASNSGVNSALNEAGGTLKLLAEAAKNVRDSIKSIFGGLDKDGKGVAQSLADATKSVKDFLASAEGQALIATLGATMGRLSAIALQLLAVLPALLPAIQGLTTGGFGTLLNIIQGVVNALTPLAVQLGGQEQLFNTLGTAIVIVTVAIKAYQLGVILVTAAQVTWAVVTKTVAVATQVATAIYNTARVAILLMGSAFTWAGAQATILGAAIWRQVAAMGAAIAGYARTAAAAIASGAQQAAALAIAAAGWTRIAVASGLATARLVAFAVVTKAVQAATIAWTAVQWLLNVALSANPLGLIIIAIVAVVAAIVLAYKNSETFRNIVDAAFKAVGAAALWLWENAIKPMWNGIVTAFNLIVAGAQFWWKAVTTYFNFVVAVATFLVNWVKASFDRMVSDFNTVVGAVAGFVGGVIAWFQNLAFGIGQKIGAAIDFVKSIPGKIKEAIGNVGSMLYDAGSKIIQGLIDGISSKIGALKDKVSGAVKAIKDYLPFSPAKVGPLSGAGAPEKSGAAIVRNLAAGMTSQRHLLDQAMAGVASDLVVAPPGINGAVRGGDGAVAGSPTGGGVRMWPSQQQRDDKPLTIVSDGSKYSQLLVEELSRAVRVRGGNVQKVLGKTQGTAV